MEIKKIHEDSRGEIFSLVGSPLKLEEISIMTCKKGFSRGGCIHRENAEHLCVLEGKLEYVYKETEKKFFSNQVILEAGQSITIPPGAPHYLIALTDCTFIEFGCFIEEKKEKYENFRKVVEKINNDKRRSNS